MGVGDTFDRLVKLMARLREPTRGCPWDRGQTLQSLRPFILEEAYELVDAIDRHEPQSIKEECGDLVLEVLFVSQICREKGTFTVGEVLDSLEDKLIRRHPHVFGPSSARDDREALARWEEIKATDQPKAESLLSDVPAAAPALARAFKLSSRAARGGFDWESAKDVLDKLGEEIRELETALASGDRDSWTEELGDMLFVMANLARHLEVDPEIALAAANRKFTKRFRHVERRLGAEGRSVSDSSLEEMEALWQEAKSEN